MTGSRPGATAATSAESQTRPPTSPLLRLAFGRSLDAMSIWFSVEVLDGASSAALWSEAYGDALVESAILSGASEWNWHRQTWGVVLELEFADEESWERFRAVASVQAALDAVPDPLTGLVVYRGRGGSAGTWAPRSRRPLIGSG